MISSFSKIGKPVARAWRLRLVSVIAVFILASPVHADEPYARNRDYDLQHSKIVLRFDIEHKKVIGEVTHTISILGESASKIAFDSVGLNIQSVIVNKSPAKFETTSDKLLVSIPAAKAGDKFEIAIRYDGQPSKGLYFILPDKDYPNRPRQIWTQGESEDTRYYLPTYDYPNDRLTTETILTVPANWLTVANGKLAGVTNAPGNMKTWTWKESVPSSTYLITVVAGELDEVKDNLRGLPLMYYAPKGFSDRLAINYGRTPEMIELFNKKFGVDYAWEKYAQVMVDDFVAGGMENSSATTNTSTSLVHPKLAGEYATGQDDLISHELAHQWFGDLVTCKDWGNLWLNEGFATFAETVWTENHYPKEQSEYQRWNNARQWFVQSNLYRKPIVRRDFEDSSEFDGNAYNKAGWVLYMLRHQLGESGFNRGLKHYLEVNRGKNVVTADFVKAMEESTHSNVDEFFTQWIFGAGAPRFDVRYSYDDAKHQVTLTVKQTQKVEDRVGIFRVPVEIEITSSSGAHLYSEVVSKATQTFVLPSSSEPLMVLFDKGGHVLKSAESHKEKKEWLYQLKNASELSDRADAAVALRKFKDDADHNDVARADAVHADAAHPVSSQSVRSKNEDVLLGLGEAARSDKAWPVRATSADSLAQLGGANAARQILAALDVAKEPWLRARIVTAMGEFKDNTEILSKLATIAQQDTSYRARAAALQAIGKLKAPNAMTTLQAAATGDSPDDFLRNAALRAFGSLGDDKALPLLREWAAAGKAFPSREAAIASLGRLQKENKEITAQLSSYLSEPHFSIRMAALYSLGARADASAIPALEEMLKSKDLSIEMAPMIKAQIARLKRPSKQKHGAEPGEEGDEQEEPEADAASHDQSVSTERFDRLEQLIKEMAERLQAIETRLPPKP